MAADYVIVAHEDEAQFMLLVEAQLDLGYTLAGGPWMAMEKNGIEEYHQALYKL